jgi:acyl carrier protein
VLGVGWQPVADSKRHEGAARMGDSTFEAIKDCLIDILQVDEQQVTPEARLKEDLKATSLDVVELAAALEIRLGIELPDADIERMKTVRDTLELVRTKS